MKSDVFCKGLGEQINYPLNYTQKNFKILPFSCFLSKHCSTGDWLLNKYFGKSSAFQWNKLLFQVRPLVIFATDCH